MIAKIHHVLDPLDVEILHRALDQACAGCKEGETVIESDCDRALETALHRELIEIARLYGVPDTLCRVGRVGMPREAPFLSSPPPLIKLTLDEWYLATPSEREVSPLSFVDVLLEVSDQATRPCWISAPRQEAEKGAHYRKEIADVFHFTLSDPSSTWRNLRVSF